MDTKAGEPIRLLTISREYGAGGSELGVLLGERLGWPVLDRDLAHRIAQRLGCGRANVEAIDERPPTLLERVAAAFTVAPAESPVAPERWRTLDPDKLVAATRAVLEEAVRELPLVVIGHGANCIFRGRRDALRIRVTAPFERRVRRIARRTGGTREAAAADVRRRDADRRHYLERYYSIDINDPNAYDLQINTGTIPIETAARLVRAIVAGEAAVGGA
ncbi:MAG TPA: cytidylate kinase-like family protein [Gemmatimonadales bacterium]|nr:cytidylate kinase-like family protein [Gemmatimonadales bacterium]